MNVDLPTADLLTKLTNTSHFELPTAVLHGWLHSLMPNGILPTHDYLYFCPDLLDEGNNDFLEDLVVEAVLAIETLCIGIVLVEGFVAVDGVVVDAEKAVGVLFVEVGDAFKLLTLHLIEVLDSLTRDAEGLLVVLAAIEEGVLTRLEHLRHGGHVEGGVDTDLAEAEHLLGIHTTHAGADDEVGLLAGTQLTQERKCLQRIHWDVGGYNRIVGQEQTQVLHRATGSTGTKAMEIDNFHFSD